MLCSFGRFGRPHGFLHVLSWSTWSLDSWNWSCTTPLFWCGKETSTHLDWKIWQIVSPSPVLTQQRSNHFCGVQGFDASASISLIFVIMLSSLSLLIFIFGKNLLAKVENMFTPLNTPAFWEMVHAVTHLIFITTFLLLLLCGFGGGWVLDFVPAE